MFMNILKTRIITVVSHNISYFQESRVYNFNTLIISGSITQNWMTNK